MLNLTPTVRNLLFLNIGFFLIQQNVSAFSLTQLGSLYPIGSPYFYPWQFLSYMFLHASWMHIISNMFGLISFGPLLEQRWGGPRFLTFWLICGFGAGGLYEGVRYYENYRMEQAAAAFHRAPTGGDFAEFFRSNFPEATGYESLARGLQKNPQSADYIDAATKAVDGVVQEVKNSPSAGMLGASGALFGILFAFAYLFPNTELVLLFFPFPIKAKYFVFFYALYELYSGTHRTPGDNVAHYAHLGGLLIGFLLIKYWERGRQQFY
ncbi:MAG: rhomboid family intramembrane serine protease [Hymenobacter sp.]|nr:MAG: rhomboid family intramembrane serine protease [Hymenobacter sp.]